MNSFEIIFRKIFSLEGVDNIYRLLYLLLLQKKDIELIPVHKTRLKSVYSMINKWWRAARAWSENRGWATCTGV